MGGGKSPFQAFVYPLSKAELLGFVLVFFIQPLCVIANEVKQSRPISKQCIIQIIPIWIHTFN
jgi:hypothetical protein